MFSMKLFCVIAMGIIPSLNGLESGILETGYYKTVVAIPDTHGDALAALASVWLTYSKVHAARRFEYIDLDAFHNAWGRFEEVGADSFTPLSPLEDVVIIQMGDLVDRGPYSTQCIDIFAGLPKFLGWKHLNLYGNHDLWLLTGDPGRYVNTYEAPLVDVDEVRARYMSQYKPGGYYHTHFTSSFFAMAKLSSSNGAMGPDSRNPATLFVHAGIDLDWFRLVMENKPEFSDLKGKTDMISDDSIDAFNRGVQAVLLNDDTTDRQKDGFFKADESFAWTREMADDADCDLVDAALTFFGVSRIIVGHTPAREIVRKCDDKFIIIDAAMSKWMYGSPPYEEKPIQGAYSKPTALVIEMTEDRQQIDSMIGYYSDEDGVELPSLVIISPLSDETSEETNSGPVVKRHKPNPDEGS
jgi:hypothetical protein